MGNNIQTVLGAGMFCFVVALVSSIRNDAHSFNDLDLVGKIFTVLTCASLWYLAYMVLFKKK
jgi:predicted small integral membrane protein